MKRGFWNAIAAMIFTFLVGAGVSVPRLLTSAEEVEKTENAIESGHEPTVPVRADLDGDGKVTSVDLAYMRRYLVGWQGYAVEDQSKYDLDGDGQITGSDVTMLRRYLAEWEEHPEESYTEGLIFEENADGKSYSATGYESPNSVKMRLMRVSEEETLVIPSYYHGLPVTEVKKEVFEALPSVTELTVGDNIATMPDEVKSLTSLTRLMIGNNVESLDVSGYQYLKEVLVSGNNQTYSTQDGVLFDKEKTALIAYPQGKEEQSYQVPETVTVIGNNAFAGNEQLKKVTMSDAVERIGENAFANTELEEVFFSGTKDEWANVTIDPSISIAGATIYYGTVEEEKSEHEHSYVETVIKATCVTEGYIKYTCSVCGICYIDDRMPATGEHSYENGACVFCGDEKSSEGLVYTLSSDGTYYEVSGIGTCTDRELAIPSTYNGKPVMSIGSNAFFDSGSLTSVTIPESVTIIGEGAFFSCSNLGTVIFAENSKCTNIGDSAFYNCSSLTSVKIPDSVTSIGNRVFSRCDSLATIIVSEKNEIYCSIDGVLFGKDGKTLICYPVGKSGAYMVPDSVTTIVSGAFYACNSLTEVTFAGNSIKSIGEYAFADCRSLTSVKIPDSVTSIGKYAFSMCNSIEKMYISKIELFCRVKFLNCFSNPLYYAKNLYCNGTLVTELVISDTVTSIGEYAFNHFESLTSVTIGNSVTSIGAHAFDGCSNLTSARFKDPAEWWVAESSAATSGTSIAESDLSDSSTAAQILRSIKRLSKNKCTITYFGLEDVINDNDNSFYLNEGIKISGNNIGDKIGYTFFGWNDTGEKTIIINKDNISQYADENNNVSITANWKPNTYRININAINKDYEKDSIGTVFYKYSTGYYKEESCTNGISNIYDYFKGIEIEGNDLILIDRFIVKGIYQAPIINNGHTYHSDVDENTIVFDRLGNSYSLDVGNKKDGEAIELYALCIPKELTVTLEDYDGVTKDSTISVAAYRFYYGEVGYKSSEEGTGIVYGKISTPIKDYYKFGGYFFGNENSIQYINGEGTCNVVLFNSITEDVTLRAQWTRKSDYKDYIYISSEAYQDVAGRDVYTMEKIRENTSANYLLISDIEGKGETWDPISSFSGFIDGDGHVISNMKIWSVKNTNDYESGFICYLSGTIKNLEVNDFEIGVSDEHKKFNVGIIAGYSTGSIENCRVINCKIESKVEARDEKYKGQEFFNNVGGICGVQRGGLIDRCFIDRINLYSEAKVAYNELRAMARVGGMVGYAADTTISHCMATNSVKMGAYAKATKGGVNKAKSATAYAGNLVGQLQYESKETSISYCVVYNNQGLSAVAEGDHENKYGFGYVIGATTNTSPTALVCFEVNGEANCWPSGTNSEYPNTQKVTDAFTYSNLVKICSGYKKYGCWMSGEDGTLQLDFSYRETQANG